MVEPDRRGTAGAIRFAADALGDDLDDRFLALNGDVLTDLDLTALLRAHERAAARATLALYPVEDSSAYGLVRRDGDGAVLEFLEKTGEAVPGEVNAGAYVLERSVLDLIPPGREVSIEREVFPRLVGEGLQALPLDGYWMDIGTPERYLQASWDILEGRVATAGRADRARGCSSTLPPRSTRSATIGPRAVVWRRAAGSPPGPRSATRSCSTAARSATGAGSAARCSPPASPSSPEPRSTARSSAGMKECPPRR